MSQKKILFGKKNYIILFLSLALIVIGFFLMSGGGSKDPNIFNPEIFNFRRIKLAPTVVIFGFVLAIFSILVKNKTSK
tara:strand:+ start:1451 stop:1684 length:234 start_codon:yes stop_codon:yes gene_type:complete